MVVKITNDNFEEEVLKSDKPVLLDFWADWCGPCKMMSPVVEELADELEGQVKVGKVNVDEEDRQWYKSACKCSKRSQKRTDIDFILI